jgi:GntR family transcriptional regulator
MEFRQSRPIYLQIADHIAEEILNGKWRPGERIPSVRELSVSVEVNPNTVMRAYAYLQDQGIIQNQRGIGYFAAQGAEEKIRSWKRQRFVGRELPLLFDTMKLLDMSFDDLKTLFAEYRQKQEKER